jgi:short-subunit dehydrogenase
MDIALVTGASSGLGKEFVLQLDRREKLDEIWIVARRKQRLEELAAQCRNPVRVLELDLTDDDALLQLEKLLREISPRLQWLVNNAGIGKPGSFESRSREHLETLMKLNTQVPVRLCHMALPYLDRGSRVINVASVAAFLPQPGFAVYAASKAFLLSFSRAWNEELRSRGVTVTTVCPNPMATEFFADNDGSIAIPKGLKSLGVETPEDVVRTALMRSGRRKDISLSCLTAQGIRLVSRILPHPFVLRVEKLIGINQEN